MIDLQGWIIGAVVAVVALVAAWARGMRSGAVRAEKRGLEQDAKAHERINEADTGIGATDGERIERLREFAAKHGNR